MKDPSHREMLEYLKTEHVPDDPSGFEFDAEEAIYWFANDYHGGQWSELYSVLSTSLFRPGPLATGPEDPTLYEMLITKYGGV